MPYDIIMCPGQDCPLKQNCSRFTDEILGRQDFFGEAPYSFTTNFCGYFIRNRPDENKIRLKAYEIWQQMSYPNDKSVENWLQAEKELIDLKI